MTRLARSLAFLPMEKRTAFPSPPPHSRTVPPSGSSVAIPVGPMDFLKEVGDPATGFAIGGTDANLKSAVEGETYEYTQMYPGFAKTAREEGFTEVAEWFETLARAEKSHAGRFQKGLDNLGKY